MDAKTKNGDLEGELAVLKDAVSTEDYQMVKEELQLAKSSLDETRKSLNEVITENDQLKIALVVAR